jgi:hypothetical protein
VSSDKEKKLKRMIDARKKRSRRKNIEDKKLSEHSEQYYGNTEE